MDIDKLVKAVAERLPVAEVRDGGDYTRIASCALDALRALPAADRVALAEWLGVRALINHPACDHAHAVLVADDEKEGG